MINSGWLLINKPKNLTSHDVIKVLRKIFPKQKMGHTGTLDPMATGVLVVAIGVTTRLIDFLKKEKTYIAKITLGIKTDTLDSTGKIIEQRSVENISKNQIFKVLNQFIGKITQIPPMVSAIKHKGKHLYEFARKGIEVERKRREVEIYNINLLEIIIPDFTIEVRCSSGTYIRTLADDIGRVLGCGAHLSDLVRTNSNGVLLEDCVNIEKIIQDNKPESFIKPVDYLLQHLPFFVIPYKKEIKIKNGNYIMISQELQENIPLKLYDSEDNIIGIGVYDGKFLKPKVILNYCLI